MLPTIATLPIVNNNFQNNNINAQATNIKSPINLQDNNYNTAVLDDRTIKVATTTVSDYDKVVARVKKKQKEEINQKLATVTATDLSNLQEICDNPNIIQTDKKSFFLHHDFPYITLKALQEQRITSMEFATLANLHAVVLELMQTNTTNDQLPVTFHALFDADKNCNTTAWKAIRDSIHLSNDYNSIMSIDLDKTITTMKQTMATKRPLEAGFYIFAISTDIEDTMNISHIISMLGINLFFDMTDDYRMLPSMSIRQEFLNAAFEDPCNINPVIGISTPKNLRDEALVRSRDFAIPFPLLTLPKEADGYLATSIVDFQNHDAYHCLRLSMIKNNHLEFYISIGDALAELQRKLTNTNKELKAIIQQKIESYPKFEDHIQHLPKEKQGKAIAMLRTKLYKTTKLVHALDNIRKAVGKFKFSFYDLEMLLCTADQNEYIDRYGSEISFHIQNIIPFLHKELLSAKDNILPNFFTKITGRTTKRVFNEYIPKHLSMANEIAKNCSLFERSKEHIAEFFTEDSEIAASYRIIDYGIKFLQA